MTTASVVTMVMRLSIQGVPVVPLIRGPLFMKGLMSINGAGIKCDTQQLYQLKMQYSFSLRMKPDISSILLDLFANTLPRIAWDMELVIWPSPTVAHYYIQP